MLTLLPAILLAMTAFTRIIIVLSILRQALGMATTPSNQILTGLALFLTFFVMSSTLEQSYAAGIKPYLDGQLAGEVAIDRTVAPLKKFMLAQTRENDLQLFSKLSGKPQFASAGRCAAQVLVPTFLTSELKTAFQIGFMVFIPFLVIDLVVASVLMSMGMMMLSPVLVSLPFKIMLFVVVDGWTLAHRYAGRRVFTNDARKRHGPRAQDADGHYLDIRAVALIALITGLVIGMLQAATQINESTLSFIPKLLMLVLTLFVAGPWILRVLIDFTHELYASIPAMIG